MANTGNASSQTKRSTTAKETKDSESAGLPLGPVTMTGTRHDIVFLATASCEAARMEMVRDGSPDPTHFKNMYKILDRVYEELTSE